MKCLYSNIFIHKIAVFYHFHVYSGILIHISLFLYAYIAAGRGCPGVVYPNIPAGRRGNFGKMRLSGGNFGTYLHLPGVNSGTSPPLIPITLLPDSLRSSICANPF